MAQYSLYVLKVPLNTKQTNRHDPDSGYRWTISTDYWSLLHFLDEIFTDR